MWGGKTDSRPQNYPFPELYHALVPEMGRFRKSGGKWGKVWEILNAPWKNGEFRG